MAGKGQRGKRGSGPGVRVHQRGYLQITRRGPDYGKLQHRVVMANLCREWCYWPIEEKTGLPAGMEVHHMDFGKQHNCPSNLILIDPALHIHMDRVYRNDRDRRDNGRFGPNMVPPVGSVVNYTVFHCPDCGLSRKVAVSWSWSYPLEDVPDWVLEENWQ